MTKYQMVSQKAVKRRQGHPRWCQALCQCHPLRDTQSLRGEVRNHSLPLTFFLVAASLLSSSADLQPTFPHQQWHSRNGMEGDEIKSYRLSNRSPFRVRSYNRLSPAASTSDSMISGFLDFSFSRNFPVLAANFAHGCVLQYLKKVPMTVQGNQSSELQIVCVLRICAAVAPFIICIPIVSVRVTVGDGRQQDLKIRCPSGFTRSL